MTEVELLALLARLEKIETEWKQFSHNELLNIRNDIKDLKRNIRKKY